MKIIVLAGGLSPERDVSLSSGALIANALVRNGHEVMLIDIINGQSQSSDIGEGFVLESSGFEFKYAVPEVEPNIEALKNDYPNEVADKVLSLCKMADVAFLALHGSVGENGKLQALLDLKRIKYTGTDFGGSMLAMDKAISKRLMEYAGITTPNWNIATINGYGEFEKSKIKAPYVVKPANCGSSIGVSLIEKEEELNEAILSALKYDVSVIIEERIVGREFSCGILGESALPIIEISPNFGFYDYRNKYQKGLSIETCPAEIGEDLASFLQETALKVHKLLGLGYYSRVDFMVDGNNKAYCLEANTLPGMTPTSLLPQEAAAAGISYEDLCERIVLA